MNTLVQFFIISLSSLMFISIVMLIYYVAKNKREMTSDVPTLNYVGIDGDGINNRRLRGENESIFDVALLGSLDLENSPQNKGILDSIRSFK